jgi:dCMP deaminase
VRNFDPVICITGSVIGIRTGTGAPRAAVAAPRIQSGPMRADWHQYFMGIAHQAATRATCPRKHVGAVIVRDRTVLSTGYNGSVRGLPHCDEVGCVMEDGHCVTTVHAEANAILQAAKNGVSLESSELYTTASPCWNCFKLIANAGIKKIYYGEFYRDERSRQVASEVGIDLVDLQMPSR